MTCNTERATNLPKQVDLEKLKNILPNFKELFKRYAWVRIEIDIIEQLIKQKSSLSAIQLAVTDVINELNKVYNPFVAADKIIAVASRKKNLPEKMKNRLEKGLARNIRRMDLVRELCQASAISRRY